VIRSGFWLSMLAALRQTAVGPLHPWLHSADRTRELRGGLGHYRNRQRLP
jgi:hypothetical protein